MAKFSFTSLAITLALITKRPNSPSTKSTSEMLTTTEMYEDRSLLRVNLSGKLLTGYKLRAKIENFAGVTG